MKTDQQLKRMRAAVNALMVLKKNHRAAPLLKGLPIFGSLRRAERSLFVVQSGVLPDEQCSLSLGRLADAFNLLLKAVDEAIKK